MKRAVYRPRTAGTTLRAGILLCALPALGGSQPGTHDIRLSGDSVSKYSLATTEGTYRVTLQITGTRGQSVAVFAEQRRLMRESIVLRGDKPVSVAFIVNMRQPDLAPQAENAAAGPRVLLKSREQDVANWDGLLSVEVTAPGSLHAIRAEPVTLPTLYLAGDSTVTDQATAPHASWGQYITRYFRDDIAVANHAESGESLKSFVTEMRLAKVLSGLREGDWVMIQFGHNDQKTQWPHTHAEAATTYRAWLRTYIAEIRRRGATPLLVTSPERRNFDNEGRIRATLAEYAEAMRAVAREEKVALLDLNASSVRIYEALGPAVSPGAFADGGNDRTHHNDYGARLLARAVIEELRISDLTLLAGLADHIADDAGIFDPSKPPLP